MRDLFVFFIKRPVATSLIVLLLLIAGIYSYFSLPVSDLPQVDYPVIAVSAFYPGASPQTVANTVATPLEQELMKVPGIESMISQSNDGFTKIILTFSLDSDVDRLIPDIERAISNAQANMPALPAPPVFKKYNPSEKPIMYILVDSKTVSHGELFDIANKRISQILRTIKGVADVSIWSVSSAVRIKVDPLKMALYKLNFSDITSAIFSNNLHASGGSLDGNYRAFTIKPAGQITSAEGYNRLIVKSNGSRPVRISDIGKAYVTPEQEKYKLKFYSARTKRYSNPILISIKKSSNTNIVNVAKEVEKKLEHIKKGLPSSIRVNIIYNRADNVITSILDLKITLVCAFMLIIFVLFIFAGSLRNALIPGMTLPISIAITFLVMKILNFTIDNLSLMAITLAIGFVVDDVIVVFENALRYIEGGMDPLNASIVSTKEITGSVISMTLSVAIVFIPIALLNNMIGRVFREFSLTAITIVLASGFVALFIAPVMNANMLKADYQSNINLLGRAVDIGLKKVIDGYGKLLSLVLKRPYISLFLWIISIVISILLYFALPKTFLPGGDSGIIFGAIKCPVGVSSKPVHRYQDEIDRSIQQNPYIENFFSVTGMNPGADNSSGIVFIDLKPKKDRPSIFQVYQMIRSKLNNLDYNLGAVYLFPYPVLNISIGGSTTAVGNRYSYMIVGADENMVFKGAKLLKSALEKSQYFTDIQSDLKFNLPQISLNVDREYANILGISLSDIENELLNAYSLGRVSQFTVGPNFYDVILQVEDRYRQRPADLSSLYIRSPKSGKMVPLSTIASWEKGVSPTTITHFNQFTAVTISFNLAHGVAIGNAINKLKEISKKSLPSSVTGRFQGEAQQFISAMRSFLILIGVAIFLLYILLGILYESYIHPFTVLTTLPTALLGGLGALFIFNYSLSLYSYIGLILLLGIVVKNGVIMVDFAIQRLNEDSSITPYQAIYQASIVRFRPILMTGLAAIAGAIPIVIDIGSLVSKRPLGVVIIGGLVVSQILTLFITPGIFLSMEKLKEKLRKKR